MKATFTILILIAIAISTISCDLLKKTDPNEIESFQYLALGDSYTIGESVCETCSFPLQLADTLNGASPIKTEVKIIAKTGWTTTDLLNAIESEKPEDNYDLVTLLIGVNNQFQGKPFSVYEEEFPKLLEKAIDLAKGKKRNVMVLSIPDYAYTPYGEKSEKKDNISKELNKYNEYAEKIARKKGVDFQDITEITRKGLNNPLWVATDGLHPSELAYEQFVHKIFQKAYYLIH